MSKIFSQSLLFVTSSLKYLGFFNFLLKIFFPFYRYNTFLINKVIYMLQSTKIKILGIVGTFAIISTAYTLHANVFYKELYPALSKKKIPATQHKTDIVEKKAEVDVVKVTEVNISKDEDIVNTVIETNNSIAEIEDEKDAIEVQNTEQNKTVVTVEPVSELERLLKENRYLYIDSSSQITSKSKETLQKLKPLLSKLDDIYIEVEGYSASKESSNSAKKDSEKFAHIIYEYLKSLDIDKEIVVTSYGDSYPIIDDTKDIRNSRVEVKIRRR